MTLQAALYALFLILLTIKSLNAVFTLYFEIKPGQEIKLEVGKTIDFNIPYVALKLLDEYDRKACPIPDEVMLESIRLLDAKSFYTCMYVSKCFYNLVKSHLRNVFEFAHGFKLNVPDCWAFTAYRAFFTNPIDLTRMPGLQNKVIDLHDFVMLNFYCSLTRASHESTRISNLFIKGNNKPIFVDKFMDISGKLNLSSSRAKFDINTTAFIVLWNYALRLKKGDVDPITAENLPYTCLALVHSSERVGIDNFFAGLSLRVAQEGKISPQVIGELIAFDSLFVNRSSSVEFHRWEAARSFLRSLAESSANINEFVAYFNVIAEKLDIPPEIEPDLIPPYILYRSLKQRGFCLDFENELKNELVEIRKVFSNYNFHFMLCFCQSLPDRVLNNELSALACLLETDAAEIEIDFDAYFDLFGDPDAFRFCFGYFVNHDKVLHMSSLINFIDYALSQGDYLAPETGPYSCVSWIYETARFGPEPIQMFVQFLKENNRGITLSRRTDIGNLFAFHLGENSTDLITSPFDYLLIGDLEEKFPWFLTKHNVNMRATVALSDFFDWDPFLRNDDRKFLASHIESINSFITERREWTLFELAVALKKKNFANAILDHPHFDKHELAHQIDGRKGFELIIEMLLAEIVPESDLNYLKKLQSRVNSILATE